MALSNISKWFSKLTSPKKSKDEQIIEKNLKLMLSNSPGSLNYFLRNIKNDPVKMNMFKSERSGPLTFFFNTDGSINSFKELEFYAKPTFFGTGYLYGNNLIEEYGNIQLTGLRIKSQEDDYSKHKVINEDLVSKYTTPNAYKILYRTMKQYNVLKKQK